jgi:2-oxoisovalerate dehydrogenase E1 component beta subunit
MIKTSVAKTGRLLIVNEDTEVTNFGEHLIYRVVQELFYELLARPRLIAGKNVPGIGLHPNLEDATVPQKAEIKAAILEIIEEVP